MAHHLVKIANRFPAPTNINGSAISRCLSRHSKKHRPIPLTKYRRHLPNMDIPSSPYQLPRLTLSPADQ
ncbi:hypothetical protein PA14OR_0838 [Pseudomonas aeruginosa]|uniref:Uncharacterized protein n=1 Tax=Pseudomonas aeruginosa (strain UCBPP-PA14) TaxID=208963 RepID=A0A0H2ZEW1_PSEAB|nr:hypothetical protein PA14_10400 [Pseudomonas aeruginosa UCBPP-PA14]SCM60707.1 hypothetical protein PA14OR_0838 [Pseudomonas aeruginosa]